MKKILLFVLSALVPLNVIAGNPYKRYTANLPFQMVEITAPAIPNYRVRLTDFCDPSVPSGLYTDAFAWAIDHLARRGGGHLEVPAGVWPTGPIVLKSRIDLHLEMGAVIEFAADENLYPLVMTDFYDGVSLICQAPLSATNAENISITGQGAIDGNGQYWRPVKKSKVTEGHWKRLLASGEGALLKKDHWHPYKDPSEKRAHRPVLVRLAGCKNVLLQGVTIQNSPNWNVHPLMCENVIVDGVLIRNPSYAQNGDALDLESCKNALIVNSKFDAGDDGICIKSGFNEHGRRRGRPCENVVVSGCTVFAGHGGFVVGSEMSGGVRNIKVENCQFLGTDTGLRFKTTRGRGGIVENIFIDGISMMNIQGDAITFNMYYGGKSVSEAVADGDRPNTVKTFPVDETTPVFRHIKISNVICNGARRAMQFIGLPEMPIDDIVLENIDIQAQQDTTFRHCTRIQQQNVRIRTQEPVRQQSANSAEPSLKDAFAGAFLMGCSINRSMAYEEDSASVALLLSQFNALSPESDLKPALLHPTPDTWTFEHGDRYVRFAAKHHLPALGHTLVWHNQTPEWFWFRDDGKPKPRKWILNNMEQYINTATSHFAGKVYAWDVINELLDEDGSYRTNKGWGKALDGDCDELVKRAFRAAHKGDPHAELYYNDYNLWRPSKLAGVVRLVNMLQAEGIRIDGVGIQAHWGLNYPDTTLIARAIDTLYALGVKVMITELDVDVLPLSKEGQMSGNVMSDPVFQREEFFNWLNPYAKGLPADVDRQLADRYGELFRVLYARRDKIDRVTFWGLHDGVSWKNKYPVPNRTNYPLLFDRKLQKKTAYHTVIQIPQ